MTITHDIATAETTSTPTPPSQRYNLLRNGTHWPSPPIRFSIGTSTIPNSLSPSAAKNAVESAFDTWNNVSNTKQVFREPNFSSDLTQITRGNRVNEFVWADLDEKVVAYAHLSWKSSARELVEVNIELNGNFAWTTNPSEAKVGYDVQNIATHEIGHNGLQDVTQYPDQTMYKKSRGLETKKRTLEKGDKAGWRQLYRT